MADHPQSVLPFPHSPRYGDDFLTAESNQDAIAWLARTQDWPERRLVIWGAAGCGKTHLSHIWARRVGAIRVSGPALSGFPDLTGAAGLAVDDADNADEAALLHLLNTARDLALPMLLTAQAPPARWRTALPDLASRVRAITTVQIRQPDDSLLRALIARLIADRQVPVPQSVQEWLLLRLPRTPAALREAVARLDAANLASRGPFTRTQAAAALAGVEGLDDITREIGTDGSRHGPD